MKNKSEKAITLIALVITIVVLIVLAAVVINLSLEENGIFNRAKTAKENYQAAVNDEQTIIAEYETIIGARDDKILELEKRIEAIENNETTETGTYIGTGTYGASNKNSLTFKKAPKFVIISTEGLELTNGANIMSFYTQGCNYSNRLFSYPTQVRGFWS